MKSGMLWFNRNKLALTLMATVALSYLFISGCTTKLATDYSSLLSKLRASGAIVEEVGEISRPFLGGEGRNIIVDGSNLQVYEYDTQEAMEVEAKFVSLDGGEIKINNIHTLIGWIDQPHYYKSGQIIVIYIGQDEEMTSLLEKLLGEQFAGS